MKKYKEWLTNEIEIMESETSENYPHEQMVEREGVLNLIDQLDEPEVKQIKELESYNDELIRDNNQLRNALDNQKVLSQGENINIVLDDLKEYIKEQQSLSQNVGLAHTSAGNDTHYRQYDYVLECINEYEPSNDLQNLIIPKQELPVIPKYVAKYLEFAKSDVSLMRVMVVAYSRDELLEWEKEYDWISENSETFARAWLNGYEVGEQKYVVPIDENHALCKFTNVVWGVYKESTDKLYLEDYFKFTEQEIKDYDERFWAFAVPVEEAELF